MSHVTFEATDGVALEGDLDRPETGHGGVAVLCHPLPTHGGSMESWMMPVLQRVLVDAGWAALRFDLRSVQGSGRDTGDAARHDRAEDRHTPERRDVAGAVEFVLRARDVAGALLVGGWSFGAHLSLLHALEDERVDAWFGIGLPYGLDVVERPDVEDELASWEAHKLFVHGSRDQFTPVDDVAVLAEVAAPPRRLEIIDGGDHFLAAQGDRLSGIVEAFVREVVAARA